MKPAKPNIIERLAAKKPAAPTVQAADLTNVLIAARRAVGGFQGQDLVNIAMSIANLEAVVAAMQPKPAPKPDAPPADQPAEKPKA